eukprot:COSAG05_NODE_968_length_6393_cov_22.036066_1_plen_698_part_10
MHCALLEHRPLARSAPLGGAARVSAQRQNLVQLCTPARWCVYFLKYNIGIPTLVCGMQRARGCRARRPRGLRASLLRPMLLLLLLLLLPRADGHWLIEPPDVPVTVSETTVGGRPAVMMSNGLISRTFLKFPNWVTWSYTSGDDDLLRSLKSEASFQVDNQTELLVGGVQGTTNFAFKNASDPLETVPTSYQYKSHRTVPIAKRYQWTPGARSSQNTAWPPLGLGLEVTFGPPTSDPIPHPPHLGPCYNCTSPCLRGQKCCANPGGKIHSGPQPGEMYPYYGKPCKQDSDCAQCVIDGTCSCVRASGQRAPATGCCMPKAPALTSNSSVDVRRFPTVIITYEMYQGLPAMSKTVKISASQAGCHTIRGLKVEQLAFQETHLGRNSHFDTDWAWFQGDRISLFTSFARGPQYPCQTGRDGWVAGCSGGAGVFGIIKDPEYKTSYQFAWPSLLVAGLPLEHSCAVSLPCVKQTAAEFCVEYGPCPPGARYQWEQMLCDASLANSSTPQSFESFTVFELLHEAGADREARGLATRRMHAKLAPQVTENPIYMHCTKSDPPSLERCVDQAAAVGFEMVIISFGAGFNLESTDPAYLSQMRKVSDYARAKGISMGGYDLLAHTRGRGHNTSIECIGPDGKPDGSTCLASQGSDDVFSHIINFINATKWGSVETDGPYEGESCSSTTHTHHRNLADSVFRNWQR